MNLVINVSRAISNNTSGWANHKHILRTDWSSITSVEQAQEVVKRLRVAFPLTEGYQIDVTNEERTGHYVDIDASNSSRLILR